jgi:hypothetical protein
MAFDLVRYDGPGKPPTIVDPDSGEVVALPDASPQLLAAVLGRAQLARQDTLDYLDEVRRALGDEIIERMDAEAEWTVGARGVKVSAPSPTAGTEQWDAELLREILDGLVNAGTITRGAGLRACKVETRHVAVPAEIKKLSKIPGVAERLAPARSVGEAPRRRVTVKIDPAEL